MPNNYILTSDGGFASEDELYHYGVLGMKWGVHKSNRLAGANERLSRKALAYDAKAAKLYGKAERQHAEKDLGRYSKAASKVSKYQRKAASIRKKALGGDDFTQLRAERKAAKLDYKAAKNQAVADRLSKTTGYGLKAMRYSIKSDNVRIKAAKARSKIASNNHYRALMDKRLSSLDADKLKKVQEPLSKYLFGKN